jgi:hypothetical protein
MAPGCAEEAVIVAAASQEAARLAAADLRDRGQTVHPMPGALIESARFARHSSEIGPTIAQKCGPAAAPPNG